MRIMDERRRGGWCGRRIVATKRGSTNNAATKTNTNSIIKKLQSREISPKPHRSFASSTSPHRFQNMRLTHQYDTHDPKHPSSSSPSPLLPFLLKRTKLVEIVAAKNLVFALTHSGLCAAFSRGYFSSFLFINSLLLPIVLISITSSFICIKTFTFFLYVSIVIDY